MKKVKKILSGITLAVVMAGSFSTPTNAGYCEEALKDCATTPEVLFLAPFSWIGCGIGYLGC